MAGLKNVYQHYGATPFETMQGGTIMDRHMQLQQRQYTPYCQLCGQELIDAREDENGHAVDPEWERTYQVHYRCYLKRNR